MSNLSYHQRREKSKKKKKNGGMVLIEQKCNNFSLRDREDVYYLWHCNSDRDGGSLWCFDDAVGYYG